MMLTPDSEFWPSLLTTMVLTMGKKTMKSWSISMGIIILSMVFLVSCKKITSCLFEWTRTANPLFQLFQDHDLFK